MASDPGSSLATTAPPISSMGLGDLPTNILAAIMDLLSEHNDVVAFGQVNRSFNNSLSHLTYWAGSGTASAALSRFPLLKSMTLRPPPIFSAGTSEMLCLTNETRFLMHLSISKWVQVSNVGFTVRMPNLRSLNLSHSGITNIDALIQLPHLQWLDLSHTAVREVSPLALCHSLVTLDISDTRVNNISCLRQSTSIRTIRACLLTRQLSSPAYFPNQIRNLELCHTEAIDSIEGLQLCHRLVSLNLTGSRIAQISVLSKCPRIMNLDLANTHISSIDVLQHLTRTESLNLSATRLTQIDVLRFCHHIRILDLSHTGVHDLSPIRHLALTLRSLDVEQTRVADLTPLSNFHKLTKLDARFSHVSDISPLSTCISLQHLDISHTDVTTIDVLIPCHQLISVNATYSNVVAAPNLLQHCPKLVDLSFCCSALIDTRLCLHEAPCLLTPDDQDEFEPSLMAAQQAKNSPLARIRCCGIM
uniref:F-box domain-containing protein n=1 Tax=Spongospora subterranea TaxID=70186 RepID=A0A0H5R7I4_9EUKA|eukprot:CRZ09717.1 hypothetical protein [Spongospora subterranea]